jgi:hypothetical protein
MKIKKNNRIIRFTNSNIFAFKMRNFSLHRHKVSFQPLSNIDRHYHKLMKQYEN